MVTAGATRQPALPALLRAARVPYATAGRSALAAAGMGDIPGNGAFVIIAVSRDRAVLGELVRWLAVSKQAVGQLVDTLEGRGYVTRSPDPADRRRALLTLTPRGEEAAAIIQKAIRRVDDELEAVVGPERIMVARQVLTALAAIGAADPGRGSGGRADVRAEPAEEGVQ